MVDVTIENFDVLRPQIESDLRSALFVAIDTEFTGLLTDPSCANQWFDSGNERYLKLKKNLKDVSICQLGLATCKVPSEQANEYKCGVYNAYVYTPSLLRQDPTVACQASALTFLAGHGFDFNKWVYEGVPFISRAQEVELQEQLCSLASGVDLSKIPLDVRDAYRSVVEWSVTAPWGQVYEVQLESSNAGDVSDACVQKSTTPTNHTSFALFLFSVLNAASNLHATVKEDVLVVRKVEEAEKNNLAKKTNAEWHQLADGCLEWATGFSHIIWLISELKVPVVVHNGLLDIMLLYKQFHGPLPKDLATFKRQCHAFLPRVYDTKLVASHLKRLYKENDNVAECLSDTSLAQLADALTSRLHLLFKPALKLPQPNKYGDRKCLHEAGYDAHLTAACFLQLSQVHFTCSLPQRHLCRALEAREHLATLKSFVNKLHVSRAAIHNLNLDGEDQLAPRPPWLIVEYTNRFFDSLKLGSPSSATEENNNTIGKNEDEKSTVQSASGPYSAPVFYDIDVLRAMQSSTSDSAGNVVDPLQKTWSIDKNGFVVHKPTVTSVSNFKIDSQQNTSAMSPEVSLDEISSNFTRNDPPFPPVLKNCTTSVRKPLPFPSVSSSKRLHSFNPDSISALLSQYGSVDVRNWRRNKFLVAAASFDTHYQILKDLRVPGLRVYPYSALKHSFLARGVLWSGLLASGSLSAYILYSCFTDAYSAH